MSKIKHHDPAYARRRLEQSAVAPAVQKPAEEAPKAPSKKQPREVKGNGKGKR